MSTTQAIVLESDAQSPTELESALRGALSAADVRLEVRSSNSPFRVDPTVLVALISGGASTLAALITGAFTIAGRGRKPSGLRIEAEDGLVLELRGAARDEALAQILAEVRGRTVRRIRIEELG